MWVRGIWLTVVFAIVAAACTPDDPVTQATPAPVVSTTTTSQAAEAVPDVTTSVTTKVPAQTATTVAYEFTPGNPRTHPASLNDDDDARGSGCSPDQAPLPDGAWFGYVKKTGGLIVSPTDPFIRLRLACLYGAGERITIEETTEEYDVPLAATTTARALDRYGGKYTKMPLQQWVFETTCLSRICPVWVYVNGGGATHLVEVDLPFVPEDFPGVIEAMPIPTREATVAVRPSGELGLWVDFQGLDQARTGPDGTYSRTGTAMPAIAVGPDRLLLATNDTVALLRKDGRIISMQGSTEMFDAVNSAWGYDGFGQGSAYQRVYFDPDSGRFFFIASGRMVGDDENGQQVVGFRNGAPCELGECIAEVFLAVSKTSRPESFSKNDWHLYALDWTLDNEAANRNFSPNATITVTTDAVIIAGGATNYPTVGDLGYVPTAKAPAPPSQQSYGKIRIIEKRLVLDGEPIEDWVDLIEGLQASKGGGANPRFTGAVNIGAADRAFVASVRSDSCEIDVWRVDDLLGSPRLIRATTSLGDTCRTAAGIDAPQLDGPLLNSAGSSELNFLSPLVVAGDSLWGARVVRSRTGNRSAIHWFEVDISQFPDIVTVQSGFEDEAGYWFHQPALTVDPAGNMVMVFRQAAADQWPTLMISGRLAADPLGQLRPSQILRQASAPYDFDRAGYYSAATTDPTDGSLWLFGQYSMAQGQWSTWVGRVWPLGF